MRWKNSLELTLDNNKMVIVKFKFNHSQSVELIKNSQEI